MSVTAYPLPRAAGNQWRQRKIMKIAIVINGGLVSEVLAEGPVEYVVIDHDCEGACEGDCATVPTPEGPQEAYVRHDDGTVAPECVATLFEAVTNFLRSV